MGILTPKFLVGKMRHPIVLCFVVAAVVTPPDILSQIVMAVPLLLLYGISILVSYLTMAEKSMNFGFGGLSEIALIFHDNPAALQHGKEKCPHLFKQAARMFAKVKVYTDKIKNQLDGREVIKSGPGQDLL